MKLKTTLAVIVLLGVNVTGSAQNCGGMPAVNGVCIPPDSATSPLNSTYGEQKATPQLPQQRWRLTWGGIAVAEGGDIGVVVGKLSKSDAKREALSRCKQWGASDCKFQLAYKNQCVAIAKPSERGEFVAGRLSISSGATVEVASSDALATCSEMRGGLECKVVYSDCTRPIVVN